MKRFRILVLIMTAVGLLAAGCGGGGDENGDENTVGAAGSPAATAAGTSPSAPETTPSPADTPVSQVPEALAFEATTLDGEPFDGASLAGKPVVFWFWAPWCPKCRSEAPNVAKVAEDTRGTVEFIGVAGLDKKPAMERFVEETGTGAITHLADEDGVVWRRLGVTQQSTYVFMKPDGSTTIDSGPLSEEELAKQVSALAGS